MQRRAMRLKEIPAATQTHKLPPPSSIGMTVGANIAPAHPATIRTGGLRAEMLGGIDVAVTASGAEHTGWWRAWRRRGGQPCCPLTCWAVGLASETRKRLGVALSPGRFWHPWSGLVAWPKPTKQKKQEDEKNPRAQIKS